MLFFVCAAEKAKRLFRIVMEADSLYVEMIARQDSIRHCVVSMAGDMYSHNTQMDSIISSLQSIAENGIGYNDVATHIALPLIIALFAFALPFIFSTINHINNKYSSRVLSELFTTAIRYKVFWWVNVGSMLLMLAYGASTILLKGEAHRFVLGLSWILLIIAGIYAISVVLFVSYCIRYNKPSNLIGIIRRRYKREAKVERFREWLRSVKEWVKRKLKRINKDNSRVYNLYRRIGRSTSDTAVEYIRIDRLVALCQYALRNSDIALFDEIIYEVDKISKEENIRYTNEQGYIISSSHPYCSSRFYDAIYAYYAQCPVNEHIEERLVRYRLTTFSKRRLVSVPGLNWLLTSMMRMGDVRKSSLIERYVKDSQWHFQFVRRLPQSVYVQGGTGEDRKKAEKDSRENWEDVCNYHFVMMAYCFSQGNYGLLKAIKKRRFYDDDLYPTYSTEILLRYLQCKKELRYEGYFEVYDTVDMLHKKIEEDCITRFAAALLLISETEQGCAYVMKKEQKELYEKSKEELKEQAEVLKSDKVFCSLFMDIDKKDIDVILKNSMDNLSEEKEQKLFEDKIDGNVEQKLTNYIQSIREIVRREVGEELFGTEATELEEIPLNDCPVLAHRLVFTNPDEGYMHQLARFIDETISARVLHVILTILKGKKVKTKKSTAVQFSRCLRKITGGMTDKYIILDVESGFSASLMPDVVGAGQFNYQGYTYYEIDHWRTSLNDTAIMDEFRGALWVVEKSLLPLLKKLEEDASPSLTVEDESSRENGTLDVRITVKPNLKLCYSRGGKIYKIEPQKVKL